MHRSARYPRAVALAILTALALAALAGPALAFETRSNAESTVPSGETVSDTLFMSGRNISMAGTVDGDLFVAGTNITVTGTVKGNLIAAGNVLDIEGTVTGDVITAGTSVTVGSNAHVGGEVFAAGTAVSLGSIFSRNLFAAGTTVHILGDASVARDAAVAGTNLVVSGKVGRDLYLAGSNGAVSGSVARNVAGQVTRLTIAPGAKVGGDVTYTSGTPASVAPGAVSGRVDRITPLPGRAGGAPNPLMLFIGWIQGLIGVALFGLLLTGAAAPVMDAAALRTRTSVWASLGFGVLAVFAAPPLAIILFVIGLILGGWWIALFGLMLLLIGMVVGYVVSAQCFGLWLLEKLGRPAAHRIPAMLLGVFIFGLLAAVPFLGFVVVQVAAMIGLGALLMTAWARPKPAPDATAAAAPLPVRSAPSASSTPAPGGLPEPPYMAATPAEPAEVWPFAPAAPAVDSPQPPHVHPYGEQAPEVEPWSAQGPEPTAGPPEPTAGPPEPPPAES